MSSESEWKPRTFISSKNKRAEKIVQKIEDFADEHDGLLGKSLIAKDVKF